MSGKQLLRVKPLSTEVQSGSIGFSWCLDKSLAPHIVDHKEKDLFVLLTAVNGDEYAERRALCPLDSGFGFIDFGKSGDFEVHGVVVQGKKGSLRDQFLSTSHGEYAEQVVVKNEDEEGCLSTYLSKAWHPGYDPYDYNRAEILTVTGHSSVVVPDGVFASGPPQWEKNWVNLFFRGAPIDQCAYRRRRMFAYTLQPIAIVLMFTVWALVNLMIALSATAFGITGLNWEAIVTPRRVTDVNALTTGADFWWADFNLHRFLKPLMFFFGAPLLSMGTTYLFYMYPGQAWYFLWEALQLAGILLGIVALSALMLFPLGASLVGYADRARVTKRSQIVCGNESGSKSVRLIYRELKQKVCRPFAR